jgi:hypothetical protein
MNANDIRRELLEQHLEIRTMCDVAENIAKRARSGDKRAGDLEGLVARLGTAIREHTAREEALLTPLVPVIDGPVGVMGEEHREAHAQIDTALRGIPPIPKEIAAVGVIALVRLMREHMDREEAAFLNEHVLRDDLVIPEPR